MEKVEEEVKDAVEIVEDFAEGMEKVSSDIGDKIPKDGILSDAVSWVEKASNVVGDAAKQVLDFFHKVLLYLLLFFLKNWLVLFLGFNAKW